VVDKESLGITGTPFRMDIERGKIREFAVATYSSNRNYVEDEFPVVPPTFLTTTLLWQTEGSDPWRKVELDGKRGLHAEQKYEFFGPPPRAGTRLNCTSRIVDIYTKQGRKGGEMTFAVMTTDFEDEQGNLIARATMTGVETARPTVEES